jgi:curli biogenesis system outer membrane secretion channel CsgG
MRFDRMIVLVLTAVMLAAATPAAAADGAKPRVAVLEFRNKAPNGWGGAGASAQDILVTELVKKGKFRVIDRERLNDLLREKNLSLSGDIDPKTAVEAGKLLGVEYLLVGSVTEFGAVQTRATTGGWLGNLPSVDVGTTRFKVALDARAISTRTGEIVWADSADDTTTDARVYVGGAGGGAVDRAQADKVIRPVCVKLVASFTSKDLPTSGLGGPGDASGIAGKIARVDGAQIYINAGAESGVKPGQAFAVVRAGNPIRDPDTGEVLGAEETRIGQIRVSAVKGPRLSVCAVVSGKGFAVGDLLKSEAAQ